MAYDNSLFDYDAGYYQVMPEVWLSGQLVEGCLFTWSQKAVDAAVNVELDDSDVLIATYPKTGQTWTMTIIRYILQAKELEEGRDTQANDLFQKIPFIETEWSDGKTGADMFQALEVPRVIKTHLPYQLWKQQLEKHPNLRVIQTMRNPKDALVSYYHHMRSDSQLGAFNGTWDQYFELFKEKRLPWGDFFEHNSDWYKFNKSREESLVLVYEEMKRSHRDHVIKIAKFLGRGLSDKAIDLIVEKSTVKDMSKNINGKLKGLSGWKSDRSLFIRKGVVGDWVNYFSDSQSEYVESKCKEYFEPLGLEFEYENAKP